MTDSTETKTVTSKSPSLYAYNVRNREGGEHDGAPTPPGEPAFLHRKTRRFMASGWGVVIDIAGWCGFWAEIGPSPQNVSARLSMRWLRDCAVGMAGLGIKGVSLHSYRYAWAERAKTAGYPERFAMEHLGHNSKAVHRAYSRKAKVELPSLGEYERQRAAFAQAAQTEPTAQAVTT